MRVRKATGADIQMILDYLRKDIENCLYLYADIWKYGVENDRLTVWFDTDEAGIQMVVMKYHRNFQIYSGPDYGSIDELLELVEAERPMGIAGRRELIERLAPHLKGRYSSEYGVIFRGVVLGEDYIHHAMRTCEVSIELAREQDAHEIAELLCTDEELGSVYTVETLTRELRDRIRTGMGRSYIIRQEGRIVAHNASYAECDLFVVISGLFVHPDYRDMDLLRWITLKTSLEFGREGKDQYFFALKNRIIRWHKRIGSTVVAEYGKLSRSAAGMAG